LKFSWKGIIRLKVLLLNGTIIGEKTKVLLSEVEQSLNKYNDQYTIELLDLKDYTMDFADGREIHDYNEDTQLLIDKMENADGYIIASTIFQGSIPGVLKNLFDLISPRGLKYKPVAMVANGGTHQHHLVIENQLKPILDYFRCLVTPNFVYTQSSQFNERNELMDEDINRRIDELAYVFSEYMKMSEAIRHHDFD